MVSGNLPNAKNQSQGHRAGRQAPSQGGAVRWYQRGAHRGCLREPLGPHHHHHDLVDEYRLAAPGARCQKDYGVDDVSRDRNPATDRHPTLERRRNMFHMRSAGREDRLLSGPHEPDEVAPRTWKNVWIGLSGMAETSSGSWVRCPLFGNFREPVTRRMFAILFCPCGANLPLPRRWV